MDMKINAYYYLNLNIYASIFIKYDNWWVFQGGQYKITLIFGKNIKLLLIYLFLRLFFNYRLDNEEVARANEKFKKIDHSER